MNISVDKLIIGNSDAALKIATSGDIPILIFPEREQGDLISRQDWKDWEMSVFCLSMSGVSLLHDKIQMLEVEPEYNIVKVFTNTGQYNIKYNFLYIDSYSNMINGIDFIIVNNNNIVIDIFYENKIKKIFDRAGKFIKTGYNGAFEQFTFIREQNKNEITVFSSIGDEDLYEFENSPPAIKLYIEDFFDKVLKLRDIEIIHQERIIKPDIIWKIKNAPNNIVIFDILNFNKPDEQSKTSWFVEKMWREIELA